jgi:SNF2 family DNA or RNA helicase
LLLWRRSVLALVLALALLARQQEQVGKLHELLKPHLLRRLKEDVEKSIPPKEETIIEVELTSIQKQYYRALLDRNRQFLMKVRTCGARISTARRPPSDIPC